MGDKNNSRENKRNWYLQIPLSFFDDPDYKRLRRKFPETVRHGTEIYLKMILLAIKDNETKRAEDVTLSYFHEDDSFSEEVALAINEDPEEVEGVINTMLKYHVLEEVQPDTWQIHFPDGTIGSITDSSLRSRKCRERARVLQSNTDATQVQHASNLYNRNRNSDSQSDSQSYIDLTVTETETENSADADSDSDSAVGVPGTAPANAVPCSAPVVGLFSFEQLKKNVNANKINLSDEGINAFLEEMENDNWTMYGKPVEKKYITRTLRQYAKTHAEYSIGTEPVSKSEGTDTIDKIAKLVRSIQTVSTEEEHEEYENVLDAFARRGEYTCNGELRTFLRFAGIEEWHLMIYCKAVGCQNLSVPVKHYSQNFIEELLNIHSKEFRHMWETIDAVWNVSKRDGLYSGDLDKQIEHWIVTNS